MNRWNAGSALLALVAVPAEAHAGETLKIGLSVPLSGAGAIWGKGGEWMCGQAAQEINGGGGIVVKDKHYDLECVAYDNKYNAAEGTRFAQTLLNRDRIKFVGCAIGTVPIETMQVLAERQGAVMFHTSWGTSTKGPKHPTASRAEHARRDHAGNGALHHPHASAGENDRAAERQRRVGTGKRGDLAADLGESGDQARRG